jgi:hypothetical protein
MLRQGNKKAHLRAGICKPAVFSSVPGSFCGGIGRICGSTSSGRTAFLSQVFRPISRLSQPPWESDYYRNVSGSREEENTSSDTDGTSDETRCLFRGIRDVSRTMRRMAVYLVTNSQKYLWIINNALKIKRLSRSCRAASAEMFRV